MTYPVYLDYILFIINLAFSSGYYYFLLLIYLISPFPETLALQNLTLFLATFAMDLNSHLR